MLSTSGNPNPPCSPQRHTERIGRRSRFTVLLNRRLPNRAYQVSDAGDVGTEGNGEGSRRLNEVSIFVSDICRLNLSRL